MGEVASFSGGNEQKSRTLHTSWTLQDAHGKGSGALGQDVTYEPA
jgi:hypothetical protein